MAMRLHHVQRSGLHCLMPEHRQRSGGAWVLSEGPIPLGRVDMFTPIRVVSVGIADERAVCSGDEQCAGERSRAREREEKRKETREEEERRSETEVRAAERRERE